MEEKKKLSKASVKMIQMIALSALVMIAGGAVFFRSFTALPFAFGVLVSSALNVLKVFLLERMVKKVVDMDDPDAGKNFVRMNYLLRYFGSAIVLLGVGLIHVYSPVPVINVWGAVFGIFTMQISVILVRMMKLDDEEIKQNNKETGPDEEM